MGVFLPQVAHDLQHQLRRLANNFFDAHRFIISGDEFLAGFIHAEHIATLKQTEEICGRIGNTHHVGFNGRTTDNHGLKLAASFKDESPIIVPEYASHGLHANAPGALRERLQAWTDQRWEYGCMFGDAIDAINFLNEVCTDARAFTVMLPITPTLMRNITTEADSRTSKRAKKLAELKGVGSLPALPRAVTKRLQDTCHLLTALNLIDSIADAKIDKHSAIIRYDGNSWENPPRPSLFAGLAHEPKGKKGSFV